MSATVGRVDYQKVIKKVDEFFTRTGIAKVAPIDVEKAALNIGVHVIRRPLEGGVSGFLFLDKSRDALLGLNSKHRNSRQRFTIAHELGHLFLHAPKVGDASFIDNDFFVINRDLLSQKGVSVEEIEANFFAAEVLMPGELLYKEVAASSATEKPTKLLKTLAQKFDVSDEAMRFRLNNLGFIRF